MAWVLDPNTGMEFWRENQEEPRGPLRKAWDFINTPITHSLGFNLTEEAGKVLDEVSPKVESWAAEVGPAVGHALASGLSETPVQTQQAPVTPEQAEVGRKVTGGAAGAVMGAAQGAVQTAESFTTPANVATMGLGAKLKSLQTAYQAAIAAGNLTAAAELANAMRTTGAALAGTSAVMTGAGVEGVVKAPSLPEKLVAGAGVAGGLAGIAGGLHAAAAGSGAGRVLADVTREPGGNPMDVSGEVETGPTVGIPEGALRMAGNPGKKAAYLRRIEEAGLKIGDTTGKSAKWIREWGEERGVDFSDVVVSQGEDWQVSKSLQVTPEEFAAMKARAAEREGLANSERTTGKLAEDNLDELLRKRRVADAAKDVVSLKRIDDEIINRFGRTVLVRAKRGLPVDELTYEAPTAEAAATPELTPEEVADFGLEGEATPTIRPQAPEPVAAAPAAEAAPAAPQPSPLEAQLAHLAEVRKRLVAMGDVRAVAEFDGEMARIQGAIERAKAEEQAQSARPAQPVGAAGMQMGQRGALKMEGESLPLQGEAGYGAAELQAVKPHVARDPDPVQPQIENAGRYIMDNFQRFVKLAKTLQTHDWLGRAKFGRGQSLAEQYEGDVHALHGQGTGTLGVRTPRWAGEGNTGALILNRTDIVHKIIIDVARQLKANTGDVIKALQWNQKFRNQVLARYRELIVDALGHEALHSLSETRDNTVEGQLMMNKAAREFLDTPHPETGVSLRQELAAYMEPGSPATEAAWSKDFSSHLDAALEAEWIRNNAGVLASDANDIMYARELRMEGKNTSGLPKDLKEKLSEAFRLQWIGRGRSANQVRQLNYQKIKIAESYARKVREEGMDPREAHRSKMAEMAALGDAGIRLAGAPDFTPEEASQLHGQVLNSPIRSNFERNIRAADAMEKVIQGKQLEKNELQLMREVFGQVAMGSQPTWLETFLDYFYKVPGTLRALVTSFDISAALRQGLIPTIAHPEIAASAFKTMFQGMWSESRMLQMDKAIFGRPLFDLGDQAGLHLAQPGGSFTLARAAMERGGAEEVYTPSYAEKIPGIGKGVQISERAYILYLNKIRAELFDKMAMQYMKAGESFEQNPQLFEDLAKAINTMTGRGDIEAAYVSKNSPIGRGLGLKENITGFKQQGEMAIPFLNTAFFAPRFMAARLAILRDLPLLYNNYSAPVRNLMLRDVALTIGTGLTALSAAAAITGGDLETDPRSSDFGKLRVGNTRYDVWGGFQPWVRIMAQIVTRERKSVTTGRVSQLKGADMESVITRFGRQKFSPGMSLAADIVLGKPTKEQMEFFHDQYPYLGRDLSNRLLPFAIQDFRDAWEQGDLESAAVAVPLTSLGLGVQTYGRPTPPPEERILP